MRLLVTIPHFCRLAAAGPSLYGSESGDVAIRYNQVLRCITALHQTYGQRQTLASATSSPANTTLRNEVDILLVTTGDQHLADHLPRHLFTQVATEVEPRHLGFACQEIMREQASRYDYFAYLEDDIEVIDSLFFNKLGWFSATFGNSALLQPNRFEAAADLEVLKCYIDGNTTQPELPEKYQDVTARPKLMADAFGRSFLFERVNNVHSGCFFLNAPQLARIASSPMFGTPTSEFFGPLESAATLMIMRAFEVYKPARENAGFLEVQHLGRRFLMPRPKTAEPEAAVTPPNPEAAIGAAPVDGDLETTPPPTIAA